MTELTTTQAAVSNKTADHLTTVQSNKSIAEVQTAMLMARQFPRDHFLAHQRILKECESLSIASSAIYRYPRGREKIEGPSIRLIEMIARNWGNITCGMNEYQQDGHSIVETFARDDESGFSDWKKFTVNHRIKLRSGDYKTLDDPRDVYEHVANFGTRRKRSNLMAIIPTYVVDDALAKCRETIRKGVSENLDEKIRALVSAFGKIGISKDLIEKRLGHKLENMSPDSFIDLRTVYSSIKDKIGKREDYFDLKAPATDDLDQKILSKAKGDKADETK